MKFSRRKSDIFTNNIINHCSNTLYPFFKSMVFKMDPELAHELTIKAMSLTGPLLRSLPTNPDLALQAMGLTFKSPLGLAAGLDKNAEAISFLTYLPFSFVEVGTVTPLPQSGNPKPRLFRYIEEESLRNGMGFNNLGATAVLKNIQNSDRREKILGVNLGKNKITSSEDAPQDYANLYETFAPHADYLVINLSSPNTPGLRDLLQGPAGRDILEAVNLKRKQFKRPLLLKVSPDMTREELSAVVNLAKTFELSGIIATNTTIMPDRGIGGVSGKLLYEKSRLTRQYLLSQLKETPEIELIGVGGFSTYENILDFWKDGGRLIQLYSAFIFQGPQLLFDIERKLANDMAVRKITKFEEFLKSL